MNENSLFAFAVTAVLIELTPGPNMGYLAVVAASAGRRAGLAATAGVAVGLLSAGIASSLGLAAIVATSGLVYELLGWSGAFYLLWLPGRDGLTRPEVSRSRLIRAVTRGFSSRALSTICSIRRPAFFTCRSLPFVSLQMLCVAGLLGLAVCREPHQRDPQARSRLRSRPRRIVQSHRHSRPF